MTHTLISFLGRTQGQSGYRKTRYRFPDGTETPETAFIGWSLRERLTPDCLVVLGTSGSMWDYLVESISLGDAGETERLELLQATEKKAVEQALLDRIAPLLRDALCCNLQLVVIPYGQQEAEQIELLQRMAEQVPANACVSLDVTHGFRHLPMLALLSALHLRVARNAHIAGIYYGAYDPDTGEAPIYDLSGLLRIADWVGALHTFDKDGDYSVFADLLEQEGVTAADHLRKAAFFERNFNIAGARRALLDFAPSLNTGLPGIGGLFNEQLRARMEWHTGHATYSRQRELARFYLEQRDYLRATLFAYEAFLTSLIDRNAGEREFDYADREQAEQAFLENKRGNPALQKDYRLLEKLRNTLAHGNPPKDEKVQGILKDERRLREELARLMRQLLG